jgi:hypothetical protein
MLFKTHRDDFVQELSARNMDPHWIERNPKPCFYEALRMCYLSINLEGQSDHGAETSDRSIDLTETSLKVKIPTLRMA